MAVLWAAALLFCQIWLVVGQSYPSCSVACISAAVPSTCNSTDTVCICQQVDQASLLSCLASSCDCTDEQTAAATFDSTCASNGVQLTLDVTCAAASSSTASSSASAGSSAASSSQDAATASSTIASSVSPSTSSSLTASSTVASSTYSTPAPASTTAPTTSVQGSTVAMVTSVPGGLSTSTAVVVFTSGDSTITTFVTSTHWYTPTPSSTSASTSSSTSSWPSATIVSVTQGSLIHHGLATGAKAGIGAGVGAAVVAAAVFSVWLFWLCRRRRRKASSIADSERYDPSILPDVLVGAPIREKRLSELHSETASRKPTFSWGNTSNTGSSHHRSPSSEEDGFHHSLSAESGQHSPPIDPTAYQRPILGNDGYWRNAQELQGGAIPGPGIAATAPAPAPAPAFDSVSQPPYLQKVQSRPVVPPGKWPPTSYDRTS